MQRGSESMVMRFFRWWFSELAALVPPALAGNAEAGQWLTVELGGERLRAVVDGARAQVLMDLPAEQVQDLQGELAAAVASLDPQRVRCRVLLPRRQVLVREFELPLAAEENLRDVLGFEMSRRTPFRAEDVHFDFQVVSRDTETQRLTVRLEVVLRPVLASVLAALNAWAPEPTKAPPPRRTEDDQECASFAFRAATFRERPHSRVNLFLALLVLGLAVALAWIPFVHQREYRGELEAQVQQARLAAAKVASLRDEMAAERDARALVVGARGGRSSMVALIEELTRALPDGTFLSRLEVGNGEVNLHGSSDGASGLIAILENAPHLDGVRFASPVTRDGSTGRERFHIVAGLARGQPAAPERN